MVRKKSKQQITNAALAAFCKMKALELYSPAWWSAHDVLWDETSAKLWEWPCIIAPDETKPDGPEQARYRQLERALRERNYS
jgi:hypothetical protein